MRNKKGDKRNKWGVCGVLAALLGVSVAIVGHTGVIAAAADTSKEDGVRTVASYFQEQKDVFVRTDVDTPAYVKNAKNGVLVESQDGGTLVYDNVIETEELTKDDLLLELQWTPKTQGVHEFSNLIVRMEDSEDPKCYVEISFYKYNHSDNTKYKATYVTVKTNTIAQYTSLAYDVVNYGTEAEPNYVVKPTLKSTKNQGTIILGSFIGAYGAVSNSVSIYYDDTEHAIYTKNLNNAQSYPDVYKESGHVDEEGRSLVLDLDDSAHMGTQKSNLWTGFPSGKAKMSFKTLELESTADAARYMILTIDNQTMEGAYLNDTTSPELTVDLQSYKEENLPTAQVGKYYPFFEATAFDKMYGDVAVSKRLYKDGKEIYVTGDGFVPTKAGEYQLDYVAYDGNRNKVQKSFSITAEAAATSVSGTFERSDAFALWDESLKNGEGKFETALYYPITLPIMNGVGGRGNVTTSLSVTYNGKAVALNGNTFRPERAGDYQVAYKLTDYVGNTEEYHYTVTAKYSELPELGTPVLPEYIPVGRAYAFPAVQANFYSLWQQRLQTYRKITVYKADGVTVIASFENDEAAVYTPTLSDGKKVIVEYSAAANETAQAVTYRKEIELVPFEKLSDLYVLSEGVTLTNGRSDMQFSFTNEEQSVKFINALSIYDGLSLTFMIPGGEEGFEYVEFILSDKYDANISLTIALYKDENKTYVSLNGGEKKAVDVSYVGGSNFRFTITKDGAFYDYNDNLIATAQDFAGFTRGFVYMQFRLQKIAGNATIGIKNIKNQSMINAPINYIKPSLTVYEELVGTADLNEKVALSQAIASDVYDGNAKIRVLIKLNGKELYSYVNEFGTFDGSVFQPTDYGVYVIEYIAEDASGNSLTKTYNVVVRDVIKPVIEIQGETPTTGKVGKALELPQAIAIDNVDPDLQVYVIVINPMNSYTLFKVEEKYVPQYVGRYIVKYYCEDANYNTVYTKEFVVQVSDK